MQEELVNACRADFLTMMQDPINFKPVVKPLVKKYINKKLDKRGVARLPKQKEPKESKVVTKQAPTQAKLLSGFEVFVSKK